MKNEMSGRILSLAVPPCPTVSGVYAPATPTPSKHGAGVISSGSNLREGDTTRSSWEEQCEFRFQDGEYVGYQYTYPDEGGEGDVCDVDNDCWSKDINMLCR